jgi:hypothetical protein
MFHEVTDALIFSASAGVTQRSRTNLSVAARNRFTNAAYDP